MIDRLEMIADEKVVVDTTSNTVTILVTAGVLQVLNADETQTLATLGQWEIYTLPIQSGKYVLKAGSEGASAYLFRVFVY